MTTNSKFDNNEKLQQLLDSEAWRADNQGFLITRAIDLCVAIGGTVPEALSYLEVNEVDYPKFLHHYAVDED